MRPELSPRVDRRRGERGLTLIELLVAIAIMTTGFIALLAGMSTLLLQVRSTGDDAQLTTVARQVATVIEGQPAQGGIAYVTCSPASGSAYQTALSPLQSGGNTIVVVSVAQAQGAGSSHIVSPNPAPAALTAVNACGGAGQSPTPDYGVQRITFRITSSQGNSITRVVYKRWN